MVKTLVIAGTQSGVGKTTITLGLIAALRERGLIVQPFKVGPDYIDAGHHGAAAGRACRNLDAWMMPPERVRALFDHAVRGADVAIIEGVMGLFDGVGYEDDAGSTAQIAKLLDAPVLLVVDAAKVARSAAALAAGFVRFDPRVRSAGFVINRVGSEKHGRGVAAAVSQTTGLPVLGWLPRDPSLAIPERHLGLVPSAEAECGPDVAQAAAAVLSGRVDVDRVMELAGDLDAPTIRASRSADNSRPVVIAVARDMAFHFCYEENLTLLEEAGARLAFFSPLRDQALPAGTAGILLSGGFPEVFAQALSANVAMHRAIRSAHAHGMPIYAECGGLMYLTQAITDGAGRTWPMVGLLPGRSVMTRRVTLGYRQARACGSSWLLQEGESVRGHEFHYSTWEERPHDPPAAFWLTPRDGEEPPRAEGACVGNLWASYVHLHFWGKPELARRFAERARAGKPDRR